MSSLEKEETEKYLELKRKLIALVKQHPSIWSNCYRHQRKDAWKTIENEMGFLYTKAKLQSLWGGLRAKYFQKIFIRTIERNFEAPKWKFFHDMSFIYDIVKENIQKKLGGISPPLFKAKPNPKGSPSYRCPCCVYNEVDINLEPHTSSVEVKQNKEIGSIAIAASKTSFENCQKTIENSTRSVDSETAPSTHSLDVEDNVNQSSFVKNSPELQKDDTNISLVQPSSSEITNDKTIDLIDDTETRLSDKSNSSDDTPAKVSAFWRRAIERPKIIEAIKANPATYLDSQTKDGSNLAWQQVLKEVGTLSLNTIKNRWRLIRIRYLNELVHERYATGIYKSTWEHFDDMEFLRPHMQKELNEIHRTRIQVQDTIKKRAEETIHKVQTTPECNGPFIEDRTNELLSSINYTPDMQFNNSDKRLIAYVNANQNFKIARVETLKPIKTYCKKPQQIEQSAVLHENTLPIHTPIEITAPQVLSSLDLTNEDDEDETDYNKEAPPRANKIRTSRGFEQNETDAHANETHKRLPSPPAFNCTYENDKSSDNAETPPPAKKLRKSTESRKIEEKTVATEIPKRLLLPPASSLTLDLTADEATIQPAATVQSQQLQLPKTQKVFPPLDLTLDDEPPVAVPEPALNNISTSIYQQGLVDELVNTSKLFPTFDLTTEEDKHQNKNESNDNDIASISKNGNAKNDENVICLDDDDSVSSYEEVIVYFARENNN